VHQFAAWCSCLIGCFGSESMCWLLDYLRMRMPSLSSQICSLKGQ
jgi:hypothetical protein